MNQPVPLVVAPTAREDFLGHTSLMVPSLAAWPSAPELSYRCEPGRGPLLCQGSYVTIVMPTNTTEALVSELRTIDTEMRAGAEQGNSPGELAEDD